MGNEMSQYICVVKSSERMSCPKVEDPIGKLRELMQVLCESAGVKDVDEIKKDMNYILEQVEKTPELDQQHQYYLIFSDTKRRAGIHEPYPTSYAHCLGMLDTRVAFLSQKAGEFANAYLRAIVVDDDEFHRLYEIYKDTSAKCEKVDGEGFLENNVIVMSVPAGTEVAPKLLDDQSKPIPYEWINPARQPKVSEPKYCGGVDNDGTVHLAEGVDPNSRQAQELYIIADIMKDTFAESVPATKKESE